MPEHARGRSAELRPGQLDRAQPAPCILRYTPYRALVLNANRADQALARNWDPVANGTFSWIDPDSHKLVQGQTYAYQVTATYRVKNHDTPDPNDFEERESIGSSPNALVTINPNARR